MSINKDATILIDIIYLILAYQNVIDIIFLYLKFRDILKYLSDNFNCNFPIYYFSIAKISAILLNRKFYNR
jgi:hypothetical protein